MDNASEEKYSKFYKPKDLYWGIGIENETYFLYNDSIELTGEYIKKNRRRERYSLDYSTNYNQEKLSTYLNKVFNNNDIYLIPQYINSHTLSKTDINGEHNTLYIVGRKTNPKYSGKSIHELFHEINEKYKEDFGNKYVFDGDTTEFITQNFYKITVDQCVSELINYKEKFITDLNNFMSIYHLPTVVFPQINYGLVRFQTNPNNVSMFNNGTYHINLTMPTKLDSEGKIKNLDLFQHQHQNAIEIIKWFEPLIIAIYGSPDIFSFEDEGKYSGGSLRLTASRYVSIGTYDTNLMKKGKQLNDLKNSMFVYLYDKSWYNKIYEQTDYKQGDHIGYDINYAKHLNLGIEFRILDFFPEKVLAELIKILVLLLDHSLAINCRFQACECKEWHEFVKDVLIEGYTASIDVKLMNIMNKFLGLPDYKNILPITTYIQNIVNFLYGKYSNSLCSKLMSPEMKKPIIFNINRYMWENNYLQYIPINNKSHLRVGKLFSFYTKIKSKENITISSTSDQKCYNLLLNTGLVDEDNDEDNLDLDEFYEKITGISNTKIFIDKYIIGY